MHKSNADNLEAALSRMEKRFDKIESLVSDTMTKIMHILARKDGE